MKPLLAVVGSNVCLLLLLMIEECVCVQCAAAKFCFLRDLSLAVGGMESEQQVAGSDLGLSKLQRYHGCEVHLCHPGGPERRRT